MSLVQINNVSITFAGFTLFSKLSFNIDIDSKIGLIGRNGYGKTTLLKIINSEMEPSDGSVSYASSTKIAYLKQHADLALDDTLYQAVLKSRIDFIVKQRKLQEARENVAFDATETNLKILEKLEEEFLTIGGYDFETNIKLILTSLGFPEDVWYNKIEKFSGGERTRIELAKILLSEYNLLLLDEPTNHLDLHMIMWLEGYLSDLGKPYIIISHDKRFLDKTVNKIYEIENKKLNIYGGNYSFYEEESRLRKEQQEKAYTQQQKFIEVTTDFIRRNKGSQKEMQARTRQKWLDKLDRVEAVGNDKRYNLKFDTIERTGNDVFTFENCKLGFPNFTLADNINLRAHYQDRIAIIGRNGCGKTTLIKVLMQEQTLLRGCCKVGSNINIGYFDQFHSSLDPSSSPKETIWALVPQQPIGYVLKYLARYGFKGDDVDKKISYMSGGEKARLNLAVLIHSQPNVLLLDEPTNHLDIMMIEDLIDSLRDYDGTIIFVSHDRNFISKLANKYWLFKNKEIKEYKDDWETVFEIFLNDLNKKSTSSKSVNTKKTDRVKKVNPFLISKKEDEIAEKEELISSLNEQKAEIEAKFSDPAIYSDNVKVQKLKDENIVLDKKLEEERDFLATLEEEYLEMID